MKKIKLFIVVATSISLFMSCGSNKKLQEAMSWKERYNALEADFNDLQQWKTTWEQRYSSLSEANAKLRTEKFASGKMQASGDKTQVPELPKPDAEGEKLTSLITQHRKAIFGLKEEVSSAMKEFNSDELGIDIQSGKLYVTMSDKL